MPTGTRFHPTIGSCRDRVFPKKPEILLTACVLPLSAKSGHQTLRVPSTYTGFAGV